jgi:hypothetical protein
MRTILSFAALAATATLLPFSVAGAQSAAVPALGPATVATQPATASTVGISAKTAGMKHMAGYLPLDWDAKAGRLYLEIPRLNTDMLWTVSLPYGTGSNDLGLDRGQIGSGEIIRFERTGPKVLMVEPNTRFRSSAKDPAEQLSVRQSFPQSVIWGFTVVAEDNSGTVLVDATDFFLHDVHGITERLTQMQQGAYKVDASRSVIAVDETKAFPKNTEVEAELTFAADTLAGRRNYVSDVSPDAHAMTVRELHSFIELPKLDGVYKPRVFNPRAGYFPDSYRDYSVPLGEDMTQRFIIRHRLIKANPACSMECNAVNPIVYYVDRGAPEPIRAALLDGARWWDQAFHAAGWVKGTFRVEYLPADADPMDVRYNIIQWVHRYTRGWSYGGAVIDPRTGEILKGNVTLGSLRGRQDYMIAESLLAPYTGNAEGVSGMHNRTWKDHAAADDPMLQMVLARIRQLAAHETGHTLGLAHNFAASTISQSDSVMDYPHPYITMDPSGHPSLKSAYAVNIGDWDKVAIDYGYRQFTPTENERDELYKILAAADKAGQIFLTDEDARPLGSASPRDHLWDNGADPTAELERVLKIRAAALKEFGPENIRPATPMAQLSQTLVTLYLSHRYQAEATSKLIGGLDYRYNLRGDGQPGPVFVSPDTQRHALTVLLQTLSPETLTLPESLLKIIPPQPPGYPRTQESFPAQTGLTFDPIAAAESAADLTLAALFNSERAARLVQYHARNSAEPSLGEVIDTTMHSLQLRPSGEGLSAEVSRAVETRAVEALLTLAANPAASSETRAVVMNKLGPIASSGSSLSSPEESAHRDAVRSRILEFTRDPAKFTPAKTIEAPPGMPIGEDDDDIVEIM